MSMLRPNLLPPHFYLHLFFSPQFWSTFQHVKYVCDNPLKTPLLPWQLIVHSLLLLHTKTAGWAWGATTNNKIQNKNINKWNSRLWQNVRMWFMTNYGSCCHCCGGCSQWYPGSQCRVITMFPQKLPQLRPHLVPVLILLLIIQSTKSETKESYASIGKNVKSKICFFVQQYKPEPGGRKLKGPALISSDLHLSVIKCNCRTIDKNIGPKLKQRVL